MKKSLLLFASLFIFGASSISANTVHNVDSTTNTSYPQKWEIIVYSGETGAILFHEVGCYTLNTVEEIINGFGGKYYKDDISYDIIGECN